MKIITKNMKFAPLLISSFLLLISTASTSLAWDGVDMKRNSTIEIQSGNLVREGSFIDFFDSSDGNYHAAKVLTTNSVSNGTEIVIEDMTENHKERTFIMNQ